MKVLVMSRYIEGDHHHLLEPLWCWFDKETGSRKGMETTVDVFSAPLHNTCSQYGWCLHEQDTDVTLLNKLMGFFFIQGGKDEGNAVNSICIQNILNKEVKRRLIHLLQETCNFMLLTVPARWSFLSVRDSGAHAPPYTHLHSFSTFSCIRYQLK